MSDSAASANPTSSDQHVEVKELLSATGAVTDDANSNTANGDNAASASSSSDDTKNTNNNNNKKRKLGETSADDAEKQPKKWRKHNPNKPKKYGLLVSYTGTNFSGLQIQPSVLTIESLIVEALNELKAIETTKPKQLELNRACRTDRGVHAVRNILCCKMKPAIIAEYESPSAFCDTLNEKIKQLAQKYPQKGKKAGEHIVRNVLVQSFTQVHDYFVPKNYCKKRTYLYLLPKRTLFGNTAINSLVHGSDTSNIVTNMSDEEIMKRLNQLLKYYEGRHSFHNFTEGGTADDIGNQSNYRHMFSVQLDENRPLVQVEGQDYFLVRLLGQSFMLHQIRRMIGLVVAVMLGLIDESIITKSMSLQYKTIVPQAPGVNLMLDSMDFNSYDTRTRQTLEKVGEWPAEIEAKCEAFKNIIYEEIVRADNELRETADFMFTLTYEHKKYGNLKETGKSDPPLGQRTLKKMQEEGVDVLTSSMNGDDAVTSQEPASVSSTVPASATVTPTVQSNQQ